MSILSVLAAFGGGAFGSAIGALPAFIMTGIIAVVGTAMGLGTGVDVVTGNIAFGSFFGPHIAFAGGVAAAAFAARKNNAIANGSLGGGNVAVAAPSGITNGADILYCLHGTGDASVFSWWYIRCNRFINKSFIRKCFSNTYRYSCNDSCNVRFNSKICYR